MTSRSLPGAVRPSSDRSPVALVRAVWTHRTLIGRLVRRDVVGRYRGSVLGLAWALFNPLLMLAVYTFVFSVVFKTRWGGTPDESRAQFALVLFVGVIVHALFAECANRAPSLMLANPNFVKKVVFPLEILPVVALGSALFHAAVSLAVLVLALAIFNDGLPATAVLLPLVLAPLVVFTLGVSWLLASLGVFVRDIGQTVTILTTVLLFLSPVFFPTSALPEDLRPLLRANPLTPAIEEARAVLIWGRAPHWATLLGYAAASVAACCGGFWWFQATRKGFADVV